MDQCTGLGDQSPSALAGHYRDWQSALLPGAVVAGPTLGRLLIGANGAPPEFEPFGPLCELDLASGLPDPLGELVSELRASDEWILHRTLSGLTGCHSATAAKSVGDPARIVLWLLGPPFEFEKDTFERSRALVHTVHGAQSGFYHWDMISGEFVASPSWYQLFQLLPEEVPHHVSFLEVLMHPEDFQREVLEQGAKAEEALRLAAEGSDGAPIIHDGECRIRRRDHSWAHVNSRSFISECDDEGRPRIKTGSVTDITRLREVEQALRHEGQLRRAVLEQLGEGIAVVEFADERIESPVVRLWTPQLVKLTGLAARALSGPGAMESLIPGERERERARVALSRLFEGSDIERVELRVQGGDGKRRHLTVSGSELNDEGPGRRFVFVVTDVTEQRAVEREAVAASVRERTFLSRDLHDSVAQTLTGSLLLLEVLAMQVRAQDHDLGVRAGQVSELLKESIRQVRGLSSMLSPVMDGSLPDALGRLADDMEATFDMPLTLSLIDDWDATPEEDGELFWIAREALMLGARKGGARKLTVKLAGAPKPELSVICRDSSSDLSLVDDAQSRRLAGYRGRAIGWEVVWEKVPDRLELRCRPIDGKPRASGKHRSPLDDQDE